MALSNGYDSPYTGEEVDEAVRWVQDQRVEGQSSIKDNSDIGQFVSSLSVKYNTEDIEVGNWSLQNGEYTCVIENIESPTVVAVNGFITINDVLTPIVLKWSFLNRVLTLYSSVSFGGSVTYFYY